VTPLVQALALLENIRLEFKKLSGDKPSSLPSVAKKKKVFVRLTLGVLRETNSLKPIPNVVKLFCTIADAQR
jgi:hypothetical protein